MTHIPSSQVPQHGNIYVRKHHQKMSSHQGVPWIQIALYLFISSMNRLLHFQGLAIIAMCLILYIYHHELRNLFICYNVHVGYLHVHTNWFTLYQYYLNFVNLLIIYWYYEKGLLLQHINKYNDNVVCLLNCCQINNWHTCNILIQFAIVIRLRRYILKCAFCQHMGNQTLSFGISQL